jgi:hypothetical protein
MAPLDPDHDWSLLFTDNPPAFVINVVETLKRRIKPRWEMA